jgi:hypothetical protein
MTELFTAIQARLLEQRANNTPPPLPSDRYNGDPASWLQNHALGYPCVFIAFTKVTPQSMAGGKATRMQVEGNLYIVQQSQQTSYQTQQGGESAHAQTMQLVNDVYDLFNGWVPTGLGGTMDIREVALATTWTDKIVDRLAFLITVNDIC